ncbi:MAG TPA: prephenate dehydratase domain-containing protein [Pyrinomonadaceae bacterium]|nr:prephenate dehydratase domain-containing protein [Pyrinomonadaceae bacterium]
MSNAPMMKSTSLREQKPLVAIAGIYGSYASDAVREYFGDDAALIEAKNFIEAVNKVKEGIARYCLLPIKNSIIGKISEAVKAVEGSELEQIGICRLEIRHCLAGIYNSHLTLIKEVVSHPAAIMQCSNFLESLGQVRFTDASDTATALQIVLAKGDPATACIVSHGFAERSGAKILAENIANHEVNWTQFEIFKLPE